MFSSSNLPPTAPRTAAPSIICADVVITGILCGDGDIQVDGRIEGNIRAATLVLGETSQVHGEVQAERVTVRGRVDGSIRAREVLLAASSHVEGDVLHTTLEVESGAVINGNFRHAADPLADQLSAPQEEEPTLPERRRPGSPMRPVDAEAAESSPAARTGTGG